MRRTSESHTLHLGRVSTRLHTSAPEAMGALLRRYRGHLNDVESDHHIQLKHAPSPTRERLGVAQRYRYETEVTDGHVRMFSTVATAEFDFHSGSGVITLDFRQRAADYYLENILRQIYQLLAIRNRAFLVHAAGAVPGPWRHGEPQDLQTRGQIFCGQSGAGKSTISKVLSEAGFDVLSDDLVLVEAEETEVRLSSTPFFGTYRPQVVAPLTCPLHAINFLEQAPQPAVRDLADAGIATAVLLSNVPFSGSLDNEHRQRLIELTSHVVHRTAVRNLAFRPDPSFLPEIGWNTKTTTERESYLTTRHEPSFKEMS